MAIDATDALDDIVGGVRAWLPDVDLTGLPITGRIQRLAHHLELAREAALRPFGITAGDFDLLATLRRRASDRPVKIRDLQRSLMLSSGGTTKRLDRLEAAGLIERHPDPNDRRGTLIALSGTGHELVDSAVPVVMRQESELVAEAIASSRDRAVVERGLRGLLLAMESASESGR